METRHHKSISLAQNFLRSPKLVRRLVAMSAIGPSDTVYEIGPGNGIIRGQRVRSKLKQVIERDGWTKKRWIEIDRIGNVYNTALSVVFHFLPVK